VRFDGLYNWPGCSIIMGKGRVFDNVNQNACKAKERE